MNRIRKYIHKSLAFPDDEDTEKLLKNLNDVMRIENWSFNQLTYEALQEFYERHHEGNPQFTLKRYGETIQVSPQDKFRQCHHKTWQQSGVHSIPICMLKKRFVFVGLQFELCQQCKSCSNYGIL